MGEIDLVGKSREERKTSIFEYETLKSTAQPHAHFEVVFEKIAEEKVKHTQSQSLILVTFDETKNKRQHSSEVLLLRLGERDTTMSKSVAI